MDNKFYNQFRPLVSQLGFTLTELVVSMGITSAGLALASQVFVGLVLDSQSMKIKTQLTAHMIDLRFYIDRQDDLEYLIANDSFNTSEMACVQDPYSTCPDVWRPFRLRSVLRDGNDQVVGTEDIVGVLDPAGNDQSLGIDFNGVSCRGFTATGTLNQRCAFQFVAEWIPVCVDMADCKSPHAIGIRVRLNINSDWGVRNLLNADQLTAMTYVPTSSSMAPAVDLYVNLWSACALLMDGRAKCWGRNAYGQAGVNSTAIHVITPDYIKDFSGTAPLSGIVKMVMGNGTHCALLSNARVTCWGENFHGGVGLGTLPESLDDFDPRYPPIVQPSKPYYLHPVGYVAGPGGPGTILESVVDIFPTEHGACAELATAPGEIFCWGELGDTALLAVNANADTNQVRLEVPETYAYDLDICPHVEGVRPPGCNPKAGGDYFATPHRITPPMPIVNSAIFTHSSGSGPLRLLAPAVHEKPSIANWTFDSGSRIACFLFNITGEASCFGSNSQGLLNFPPGLPSNHVMTPSHRITDIGQSHPAGGFSTSVLGGIKSLVLEGEDHACAVLSSGRMVCWGRDYGGWAGGEPLNGLLGDANGTVDVSPEPRYVSNYDPVAGAHLESIVQASSSWTSTCALNSTGEAFCWGSNRSGGLGSSALGVGGAGAFSDRPVKVDVPESIKKVEAGMYMGCALTVSNRVYCWGIGNFGTKGPDPANPNTPYPTSATPNLVMGL